MGAGNIEIGPQVPQKELKGYSKTTEVIIPILQAVTVMVAVDVLAGLLVYLAVYVGPTWLQAVLGLPLFLGTAIVVGQARDKRRRTIGFIVGGSALAAQQGLLMQAADVWPWEWVMGQFWWAWVYTCWLGPVVGCLVLIWRFVNEVRDPWWPRPQIVNGQPPVEPPKVVVKETPLYIKRWNGNNALDNSVKDNNERNEPAKQMAIQNPVYTLGDDLRAFVVEAHRRGRGLERSNWIKPNTPRVKLWPSGRSVTRGYYDQLISILRQANLVNWVGPGTAMTWACSLEEVLDCIEEGYREGGQAAGRQETG